MGRKGKEGEVGSKMEAESRKNQILSVRAEL